METVVFYNLVAMSSCGFLFLSEKARSALVRHFFLILAFCVVFIPSAIRYDIGTDFQAYIHIYKELGEYFWMEKGFYFVNWLLKEFGASAQWSIAAFSFIFTVAVFLSLPKKHKCLFFLSVIFVLYLYSFNGIRQAIAVAFSILAFQCILSEKRGGGKSIVMFFLIIVLAGFFHKSAWLLLLIGALSLAPIPRLAKFYFLPMAMLLFLFLVTLSPGILFQPISQFLAFLGLDKYAGYFSSEKHFVARGLSLFFAVGVVLKQAIPIYVIVMSKQLIKENPAYFYYILSAFAYSVAYILSSQVAIFGRAVALFSFVPVFAPYIFWTMSTNRRLHKVAAVISFLIIFLTFQKNSLGIPTEYNDPMLNPYETFV
ncbi:EpsG family protein [Halomonas sp. V046]|uniref:EpsG family protein n=1 Tax=Halomonas sp. V046 TaxID=3459611 RepID=UPI0040444CDE